MSKYDGWIDYLKNHAQSPWRVSFSEIENLFGKLPPSAFKYHAWWSNNQNLWRKFGWRTKDLDLVRKKVTFYKEKEGDGSERRRRLERPSDREEVQPPNPEIQPRGSERPSDREEVQPPNPDRPSPRRPDRPDGGEVQPHCPEPHRGPSWSVVVFVLVSIAILVLHVGRVFHP